jgi:hypothetical protein
MVAPVVLRAGTELRGGDGGDTGLLYSRGDLQRRSGTVKQYPT